MTGRPREPASLIAGTGAFRILRRTSGNSDTLGPDNGGDSGSAYLEGLLSASQLPGPFTLCASTGLSPHPGSLNPASRATIPDRSLSLSIDDSIPHFIWEVKRTRFRLALASCGGRFRLFLTQGASARREPGVMGTVLAQVKPASYSPPSQSDTQLYYLTLHSGVGLIARHRLIGEAHIEIAKHIPTDGRHRYCYEHAPYPPYAASHDQH